MGGTDSEVTDRRKDGREGARRQLWRALKSSGNYKAALAGRATMALALRREGGARPPSVVPHRRVARKGLNAASRQRKDTTRC